MKNIIYLFCYLGIFLFFSCEKDANLETPSVSPKLVIHSFICPDDTVLKIHLSTTRNIFGQIKDYPKIIPAKVVMFDGEEEIDFNPLDEQGFWYSKHKILPGREYRLLVKCPGYPDVTAHCKVPELKNFQIGIDTTSEYLEYYYDEYIPKGPLSHDGFYDQKINVKIKDIAGETNYFNVMAYETIERFYGMKTEVLFINETENNDDFFYGYKTNKIVSDKLRDGSDFQVTFSNHFIKNDTSQYAIELNALVMETDMPYYKYHSSINNYSGTDQPFTEFSPVYSNVSGGYGIFASYVAYKKTLKLK